MTEELWHSGDWVAEEKYDGDRRIVQFCDGVARVTGRRKSVKDGLYVEKTENLPQMQKGHVKKLEGTVLDGEIIFVGKTEGGASKYVTSIMGSDPDKAIAKQKERGWLRFMAFDCLFYKGKDIRALPFAARREYLVRALVAWRNQHVGLAYQHPTDKRKFYDLVVSKGGEGVILKNVHAPYGDDKSWVKVKKSMSEDVIITGFEMARAMSKKSNGEISMTKYAAAGLIGAVEVSQYVDGKLTVVGTVSGMSDDVRKDLSGKDRAQYLGQVIEIEHNGREPTGRFRHPRFVRFRPDKGAEQCVWERVSSD